MVLHAASALAGLLIGCLAAIDILMCVASTSGGGPASMLVAEMLWRGALRLQRRRKTHALLAHVAPVLIVSVIAVWIALLWCGWTLVFLAEDVAVLDATTRMPAPWPDRIYFVGLSLFTLGTGDFVAGEAIWRLASVACSFTGLAAVTLSLTYVLSVVSAATAKRQLALMIHGLGDNAVEILTNSWNGKNLSSLEGQLSQITPLLLLHSERHLAYPIVSFFSAAEPDAALGLAVAALDDALLIAGEGLDDSARPSVLSLRSARFAIGKFLDRARRSKEARPRSAPPLPDIHSLRLRGLPLVSESDLQRIFENAAARRHSMQRVVNGEGWEWNRGL